MSVLSRAETVKDKNDIEAEPLSPSKEDSDSSRSTGCQEAAKGAKHLMVFISGCLLFLAVVFGLAVIFLYIFYNLSE